MPPLNKVFMKTGLPFVLFHAGGAEAAAVGVGEGVAFLERDGGLDGKDAELADAVALLDDGVARGVDGELPFVVRAAVAVVDDADGVGLQDAPAPERRRARGGAGLVALRQLHRYAQRDQREIARAQLHGLRGVQIDPVALAGLLQAGQIVGKIVNFDGGHGSSYCRSSQRTTAPVFRLAGTSISR